MKAEPVSVPESALTFSVWEVEITVEDGRNTNIEKKLLVGHKRDRATARDLLNRRYKALDASYGPMYDWGVACYSENGLEMLRQRRYKQEA